MVFVWLFFLVCFLVCFGGFFVVLFCFLFVFYVGHNFDGWPCREQKENDK